VALLSRKADYALLILSYLHHRTEGGSARQVAERFALSRAFTANILKSLCRKGFVRSQRGTHGGYVLARPAGEICLCELLDSLGEPFHLAPCSGTIPEDCCAVADVCLVRAAIAEVDRRIRDVLRNVTLAELCGPEATPPPRPLPEAERGRKKFRRPSPQGGEVGGVLSLPLSGR
jgi:Rrf2 family protein